MVPLILDLYELSIRFADKIGIDYLEDTVINETSEQKRKEGKQYAIAAVITFVVMVSAWGIVKMVSSSIFGA